MSLFDAYCRLDGFISGEVLCNEKMSRHVTYRIGGPASLFIQCDSVSDLILATKVLAEEEVPWVVIGKGSNLLVSDDGYKGAVITLGKEFRRHVFDEDGSVVAGAGVSLSRLVQDAFNQGFSGFEFAVGIPGTLGGAVAMNAGTRDEWIGSIVESVTVFRPGEGLVRYHGVEIPWSYRQSGIPHREIILEAAMRLTPGDTGRIRAKMEASLNRRKRSQPLSLPNAGSVFRNPEGDSSGRLIEDAGLKGYRMGGAQVSEVHANFIVNVDNATAQDVINLIVFVRDQVKEMHGVELKPEVKFLGFPVS